MKRRDEGKKKQKEGRKRRKREGRMEGRKEMGHLLHILKHIMFRF